MDALPVSGRAGWVLAALCALSTITQSADAADRASMQPSIPNFTPNDHTSWHPDRPDGGNFLPPESGPGSIMSREDHPYVPNGEGDFSVTNLTSRITDLSNPILKPEVDLITDLEIRDDLG